MPDVLDREPLVERHDIAVALRFKRVQGLIVIGAARDGLFEYGWIGGHAGQPVLLHQLLQPALRQESSGQEVQPHRLSVIMQAHEWIRDLLWLALRRHAEAIPLCFAIFSFAAAITCACVNLNFASRSLSGADAPNEVMPIR